MTGDVLQLKLESKGKTLGVYPFYLDRDTVIPKEKALQVDPYAIVKATIVGDFGGGDNSYFDLVAGLDPDIQFSSRSIARGDVEIRLENWDSKERQNLFAQVFGPSLLTLRYWENFAGDDHNSRPVLQVPVNGYIPDEKKSLYTYLRQYLQQYDNGRFLLETLRGQIQEKYDLLFVPGFSSNDDPLVHLGYIKGLVNKPFSQHLEGIIRSPVTSFRQGVICGKASTFRRLTKRNVEKAESVGWDNCNIVEKLSKPSFLCGCNNVVSTFLYKLVCRLAAIRRALERRITELESTYKDERGRIQKTLKKQPNAVPKKYAIPRAESDKEMLMKYITECDQLSETLAMFLSYPVFAYSPSRREVIFRVPYSDFSRTNNYQHIYHSIWEYERTSFYWIGDTSTFFQLPAYCYSAKGTNCWVKKYSMMYEYWCYLRIHDVFSNFGFDTHDHPGVSPMQCSVFESKKQSLRIYLYHDVKDGSRYRSPNHLSPRSNNNKTPDFAIIFENSKTSKASILILDSKADASRLNGKRLKETIEKYCNVDIGKKRSADLVLRQCWFIFSGEAEEKTIPQHFIETPPAMPQALWMSLPSSITDFSDFFSWSNGGFHINLPAFDYDETPTFVGHLRSHVHREEDSLSPDHFEEFLSAQVKLMEQLLAEEMELK